jgi:hypothetical protein
MMTTGRWVMGEGARRLGRAMAVAAVFSLGAIAPAQAFQFGDLLRGAAASLPKMPAKPAPAPAPSQAPAAGNAPGAMGLQAGTALPPLHKLGTDAVAVIETASPGAPVRAMDYVFAKQSFALGPKGAVTMSYLSGCLTETIAGGTVTVDPGGSRVAGGRLTARPTPGCKAAKPIILASASEAGATVNRITPFTGVNWEERELKSGPPVFKWDRALGAVTAVRVKNMDQTGQPVIWQTAAAGDFAAYPATAAPLAPGAPFKVEALSGDRVVASALFSIDPALDVAVSLANRVVPLSAP